MANKRRYIPAERQNASARSNQNRTRTTSRSQGPVRSGPYWDILINIVPKETRVAGANKDSVG